MGYCATDRSVRAKRTVTRVIAQTRLVIAARNGWSEKVEGFRAGANDYLTKPFRVEELVMRLRALIRRAAGHAVAIIHCGVWPSMRRPGNSNWIACPCA